MKPFLTRKQRQSFKNKDLQETNTNDVIWGQLKLWLMPPPSIVVLLVPLILI
jgi:hypothetical protein